MTLEIHPARRRFRTVAGGRVTWHSFSFGAHYDPENVGFGPLVALNDERLEPGAGYADHGHRGVELVTWVVEGSLVHADSSGAREVLPAGTVQVQTAGSGIAHSEHAGPGPGPTRFVQAWLRPDDEDRPPERRTVNVGDVLRALARSSRAMPTRRCRWAWPAPRCGPLRCSPATPRRSRRRRWRTPSWPRGKARSGTRRAGRSASERETPCVSSRSPAGP